MAPSTASSPPPLLLRSRVALTSAHHAAPAPATATAPVAYHTAFSPRGASTALLSVAQLLRDPPRPPLWLALDLSFEHALPALLACYQLPLPLRLGVSGHVASPPLLASICVPPVGDAPQFALLAVVADDVVVTCCSGVADGHFDDALLRRERALRCVADVLHIVVVAVCRRLLSASRRNLDELDALEARVALQLTRPESVAHSVWKIRRTAATLRRVHQGAKSLIEATERRSHTSPARVYSAQSAELLASVREGAHSLLEVLLAVQNNRMQETMQTLAVVTTIFVPLTFLAGIEGMNFRYMPELDGRWSYGAFWMVVIVLVVLQLAFFRKKRWI